MKYYSVDFGYYPCVTVNFPDSDDRSQEASSLLMAAERLVEQKAREQGVEMVHGYAWPDGSLYKYIRSELPREQLHSIFSITHTLSRPARDGREAEEIEMQIYPSLHPMELSQAQCIGPGSALYLTLEERFEFAKQNQAADDDGKSQREAMMALHDQRKQELDNLPAYRAYDLAREACPICVPGKTACKDCSKVHESSWAARTAWLGKLRPMAEA